MTKNRVQLALFEKAGRGIRLTVPGKLVLAEARRTLAAADAMVRIAHAGADGRRERCGSGTAASSRFVQ
jgi:DNA-binding transcriptional LysR family regulator